MKILQGKTNAQSFSKTRAAKRLIATWFLGTFAAGYGWGLYTFWPLIA